MIKINLWEIIISSWQWIKILWPAWMIIGLVLLIKIIFEILLPELARKIKNKFYPKIWRRSYFNKKYQPTPESRELNRLLKNYGWNTELEKWDGYKHIDIAITEAKVNIEVDGVQHNLSPEQALKDLERTYYSFKKGYITLRIPNVLMRDTKIIEITAQFINKFLRESDRQLNQHYETQ